MQLLWPINGDQCSYNPWKAACMVYFTNMIEQWIAVSISAARGAGVVFISSRTWIAFRRLYIQQYVWQQLGGTSSVSVCVSVCLCLIDERCGVAWCAWAVPWTRSRRRLSGTLLLAAGRPLLRPHCPLGIRCLLTAAPSTSRRRRRRQRSGWVHHADSGRASGRNGGPRLAGGGWELRQWSALRWQHGWCARRTMHRSLMTHCWRGWRSM